MHAISREGHAVVATLQAHRHQGRIGRDVVAAVSTQHRLHRRELESCRHRPGHRQLVRTALAIHGLAHHVACSSQVQRKHIRLLRTRQGCAALRVGHRKAIGAASQPQINDITCRGQISSAVIGRVFSGSKAVLVDDCIDRRTFRHHQYILHELVRPEITHKINTARHQERVTTVATIEAIVTNATSQCVVTGVAVQHIIPAGTTDGVATTRARQRVVAITTNYRKAIRLTDKVEQNPARVAGVNRFDASELRVIRGIKSPRILFGANHQGVEIIAPIHRVVRGKPNNRVIPVVGRNQVSATATSDGIRTRSAVNGVIASGGKRDD